MTDDIERRVREHLRQLRLPDAPPALHAQVAHLREGVDVHPQRRRSGRPMLLVAAAIALSAAVGAFVLGGSPDPAPSTAPSPTAVDGPLRFLAPGISVDLPEGWSDQSTLVTVGDVPGQRFVAMLSRGMTPCPNGFYAPAAPTPSQASCDREPTKPGSALLVIVEYTQPYPGMELPGPAVTLAGYAGWEREMSTGPVWLVNSPDGGAYTFQVYAPPDDVARVTTEIRTILGTLRLSSWAASPAVVGGLIHEDAGGVFSFDYPGDWVRYYPIDISMMDSAVVTVASRPVLPPCDSADCQRFTTPPGTVVIEFRVGGGPTAPDWSHAPTTVGGQPAVREDWETVVTGGDEGHSWRVRLTDRSQLGIFASLRGPDLSALRTPMDDVIASVTIEPEPAATP